MRLLLYADPWIVLQIPFFSCSWLDLFFAPLTQTLAPAITSGTLQVYLLCGNHHVEWIASGAGKKFPEGVEIRGIDYGPLISLFANSVEANCCWLKEPYPQERASRLNQLISQALGHFEPDIILSFASPAPFLKVLFPNALIFYVEAGLGVRRPFHPSWQFDPCGVMSQSFMSRFQAEVTRQPAGPAEAEWVTLFRGRIARRIEAGNPFLSFIKETKAQNNFKHYVLLPLQVSGYFTFDCCCRFKTQFDLMIHVLENISPDTGVFVTEYYFPEERLNPMTPAVVRFCRKRYKNFLFLEEFSRYQAPSQYLYDHVDAVITVSSSVGIQFALIWQKLLCVLGDSQLTVLADCLDIDALNDRLSGLSSPLNSPQTVAHDTRTALLYYLLTRYYVPENYLRDARWIEDFLRRSLAAYRKIGGIGPDFFEPVDSDERLLACHLSEVDDPLPLLFRPKGEGFRTILSRGATRLIKFLGSLIFIRHMFTLVF